MGKNNRRHGKMDKLPQELKETVDELIKNSDATYADIVELLAGEGYRVSTSMVCRYAQRYYKSLQILQMQQQNFEMISRELDKHPDLDVTEAILRLMSGNIYNAIIAKGDKAFTDMEPVDLAKQANALIKAVAQKRRADYQNRDAEEIGLEQVKGLLFDALAKERPDLYEQVSAFIDAKKESGLENSLQEGG